MPDLSPTSTVPCHPLCTGLPAATALPLRQRLRHALLRWWLRQCLHAERKTRFVPYY